MENTNVFNKSKLIGLSIVMLLSLSGCNDTMEPDTVTQTDGELNAPTSIEQEAPKYDDNIEGIRNAVNDQFSAALTLGQALEGWKECKNSEWISKTGDRGENLAIFKCELINQRYYVDSRIKKAQYALIFASSVDGSTFKPESNALIFTFADGKTFTYERDPLLDLAMGRSISYSGNSVIDNLTAIYANKGVFAEVSNTEGFYEKRE